MDYQEMKNKFLRDQPADMKALMEGLTQNELQTLAEILDWLVGDCGGIVKAADLWGNAVVSDDGELITAENLSTILKMAQEAFDSGGEKKVVVPNVMGFLLKAQEEYKERGNAKDRNSEP